MDPLIKAGEMNLMNIYTAAIAARRLTKADTRTQEEQRQM